MAYMVTRAVAPPMTPLGFPEPRLCPARRIHGIVETPEEEPEAAAAAGANNEPTTTARHGPPALRRRSSVAGNILLLDHPVQGRKAFLLQRKTATTAYGGSVRVGFCLQGDKPGEGGLWAMAHKDVAAVESEEAVETVPSNNNKDYPAAASRKRDHEMMTAITRQQYDMVTICIESESRLLSSMGETAAEVSSGSRTTSTLKTELAAIQFIAEQSKTTDADHLWGTSLVGNDNGWVCAILSPFPSDGSLLDYCISHPSGALSLDEAKFFFRQILKVRT